MSFDVETLVGNQITRTDRRAGGVLPYMGYIRICRGEEYGFQAVYSRIEFINQSVWV